MELSPFLGSIIGNIVIAIGIIIVIYVTKIIQNRLVAYIEYITALTVGLLLGIIFLGFLPELINESQIGGVQVGSFILIGIFIFYLLELFLHWHHCKDLGHDGVCETNNDHHHEHEHEHENGLLMFGGTLLHNIFHGIELFAAFAIDIRLGIATTLAIFLHSIPQNIVNFLMNHNNIKYSYFAAIGGILGALLTYPFSDFLLENKFYMLAIIVGGLLYTALADIFPEFKGKGTTGKKLSYLVFIVLGIFIFLGFQTIAEKSHDISTSDGEKIGNINGENAKKCIDNAGNWLSGSYECEGIPENTCSELGGKFNECASPCRNDPKAEACIMMCVSVCQFDK